MTDPVITKLAAVAPLAIGGVLLLFDPIYLRLIEPGATGELKQSRRADVTPCRGPFNAS